MKKLIIIPLLFLSLLLSANTYYVATNGSDENVGSLASPWASWEYAFHTAIAGDTVFFKGGTYFTTVTDGQGIRYIPGSSLGNDGTAVNPIVFMNYPGEIPILDCSGATATYNGYNRGFFISGADYFEIWGLHVINVNQRSTYNDICFAFDVEYCNNILFRNVVVHNIMGVGISIGENWDASIINCDAYSCNDPYSQSNTRPGDYGMGIDNASDNLSNTYSNYVYGCRTWNCADMGFTSGNYGQVIYENCWSFDNGDAVNYPYGDGHGWKLGYWNHAVTRDTSIIVKNCISAYNRKTGFAGNETGVSYCGPYRIYNSIAYLNGRDGFGGEDTDDSDAREYYRVLRNNWSYGNVRFASYYEGVYTHDHNSWDAPPSVTVSDADFLSVVSTGLAGNRQADGSLPILTFLHLATGSDLIDAGVAVADVVTDGDSLAWGDPPSIGAFEYRDAANTETDIISFTFPNQIGSSVISAVAHTVTGVLEAGEDITAITPVIGLSFGATSNPATGVEDDYTAPVTITVTAEDAVTEQEWTVTITEDTEPIPTVATVGTTSADHTAITANVTGRIYSANGGTLTERGVCWSTTNTSPTVSDKRTLYTPYVGSYTDIIRGLRSNTTYYFRAYATTSEGGVSYGNAISFTTLASSVPTKSGKVLLHNGQIILAK